MNAKELQIDTWRKEAEKEYEQWLDILDYQQEQQAQLIEHGHVPSPTGGYHAEV